MCAFAMFLKYLVVKLIRNMHDLDVTSIMQTGSFIIGEMESSEKPWVLFWVRSIPT